MFDNAVSDIAVLLKFTVDVGRLHGRGREPWSVLNESKHPVDVFVCENCKKSVQVKLTACVITVTNQIYYEIKKDK